jgi:hypothetical protein
MTEIQNLTSQLRKIKAAIPENTEGKVVSPDGLDETMESPETG